MRNFISAFIVASALAAVDPQVDGVSRKLDAIESGQAKPGAVFVFTPSELNAWVRVKAPAIVPQGFRKPRLELGSGTAAGYALVDFLKVRNAAGLETNWLVAKLIEGEKPVQATAQIQSANDRSSDARRNRGARGERIYSRFSDSHVFPAALSERQDRRTSRVGRQH